MQLSLHKNIYIFPVETYYTQAWPDLTKTVTLQYIIIAHARGMAIFHEAKVRVEYPYQGSNESYTQWGKRVQ